MASQTPFGWVLIGAEKQINKSDFTREDAVQLHTNVTIHHVSHTDASQNDMKEQNIQKNPEASSRKTGHDESLHTGSREEEWLNEPLEDATLVHCMRWFAFGW